MDSDDSILSLPALSESQITLARASIADFERGLEPGGPDGVKITFAKLAMVLPKKQRSDQESAFLVETYADALADIPADILASAYQRLIRTAQFFPTISEIRAAAQPEMTKRSWLLMRLKTMVARGPAEPPKDICTPNQAAEIKAELGLSAEAAALLDRIVGSEAA